MTEFTLVLLKLKSGCQRLVLGPVGHACGSVMCIYPGFGFLTENHTATEDSLSEL